MKNLFNLIIIAGIVMVFVGITVTLYGLYRKKWRVSDALKYFLSTSVMGLFVSSIGYIIIKIGKVNLNTEMYQYIIPVEYILSLCFLSLFIFRKEQPN